jgi:hypothetical protein
MLHNLDGQIDSARARRKFRLENAAPMASCFDPRLSNLRMPAPQGQLRFTRPSLQSLPYDEADIAFSTVGQLSDWPSSGALTSRRLTEIYLERIKALAPRLECFAIMTRERALAKAEAADALLSAGINLGPLHGVPYGLKDLFDTKGVITGWGAPAPPHVRLRCDHRFD